MRHCVLLTLLIIALNSFSQNILTGVIIKTGISHATQQWGISPFAHIRPPEKSIQSGYMFLGYDILNKSNVDLIIGLQYAEKGFRIAYQNEIPGRLKQDAAYQYLLRYLELPLTFRLRKDRFYFSGGVVFSYLVGDTYSYREKIIAIDKYTGSEIEYNIAYEVSYNSLVKRMNEYDWGILTGVSYELKKGVELDFTIQKHFLQIDNWHQKDLVYNLVFLSGIKLNL